MIKAAQDFRSFQLFKKPDSLKVQDKETTSLFFQARFKYSLCLIVNTLNYILTYNSFRFDQTHIYFWLSDLLITILVIEFLIVGIKALDKYLPWQQDQNKRLLVQLAALTPVVAFFTIFVNELSEVIIRTGRIDLNFYSFDMIVALVFILMVQLIYIAIHFIENRPVLAMATRPSSSQIKVTQGTTTKILYETQIMAAFVMSNLTYVLDEECKRFLCNDPLKELEEKLSGRFFRANRQFIISRRYVLGFKSLDFGKIEVQLTCEDKLTPSSIVISRKKASQFRKWIAHS